MCVVLRLEETSEKEKSTATKMKAVGNKQVVVVNE